MRGRPGLGRGTCRFEGNCERDTNCYITLLTTCFTVSRGAYTTGHGIINVCLCLQRYAFSIYRFTSQSSISETVETGEPGQQ